MNVLEDEYMKIQKMREERQSDNSVFMQFVHNSRQYNDYVFCFYEGEDGKYYDSRIRQLFGNKICTYTVRGKKNVLKLFDKIQRDDYYEDVCTMFFVDSDYDEALSQERKSDKIFETPCYSIENLYVQDECLMRILQSEFGLNEIDEDFKKCMQDFKNREDDFNSKIFDFNAMLYLQRKKNNLKKNYSFNSIKTSKLLKVGIKEVKISKEYDKTMSKIKETLEIKDEEIEKAKKELLKKGPLSIVFRGKNQLDFFVEFIKIIKELNKCSKYFKIKHNNVHLNITDNRLSELSQYAITPVELQKFLADNKRKFTELHKS